MRHYKVTLAVVAVQRKLCIFGAMLRATWCALRGWETLLASRSRIPDTLGLRGFSFGWFSSRFGGTRTSPP